MVQSWNAAGGVTKATENVTIASGNPSACTGDTSVRAVTICNPTNGSSNNSPVALSAIATDPSSTVTAMAVYVDNALAYKVNAPNVGTSLSMSSGSHYIVVQSWNSAGVVTKAAETIKVQ